MPPTERRTRHSMPRNGAKDNGSFAAGGQCLAFWQRQKAFRNANDAQFHRERQYLNIGRQRTQLLPRRYKCSTRADGLPQRFHVAEHHTASRRDAAGSQSKHLGFFLCILKFKFKIYPEILFPCG